MITIQQLAEQEVALSKEIDPNIFTAVDTWSKKIFLGKTLNPETGPKPIREGMAKFTLAMLSLCPDIPIQDESGLRSYVNSALNYYAKI